ncbi:hypothetical protein CLOSTASPAR_04824 [[Clostridium] asparagiforme DSM 15981]|uniref:Uncharacterized protein n=1 Tax=[Clostridium] asparagiforme DSM 15981 TaxID=518636 RepID=C0D6C7_9FIRM|nr:hypothetical protein CLOSTASPAR_04824 [[Clostridium] asparagiforme DSM 15981]
MVLAIFFAKFSCQPNSCGHSSEIFPEGSLHVTKSPGVLVCYKNPELLCSFIM